MTQLNEDIFVPDYLTIQEVKIALIELEQYKIENRDLEDVYFLLDMNNGKLRIKGYDKNGVDELCKSINADLIEFFINELIIEYSNTN